MTRAMKQNADINVWAAVNGDAYAPLLGAGNIMVVLNGNNPPTVKAYSSFYVHGTDTFTSPSTPATLNNVYPSNTSLTYLLPQIIFEPADKTFAWNTAAGATSAGIPTKSNSTTYYLFCTGSQDVDSTSRGKGLYGVSTNAPTWSDEKNGFYSADGRVIAKFYVDSGGNVCNLIVLEDDVRGFGFVDGADAGVINMVLAPNRKRFKIFYGLKSSYSGLVLYCVINGFATGNYTGRSTYLGSTGEGASPPIAWCWTTYDGYGEGNIGIYTDQIHGFQVLENVYHSGVAGAEQVIFNANNITDVNVAAITAIQITSNTASNIKSGTYFILKKY